MNQLVQRSKDFLYRYEMDPEQFDIKKGSSLFLDEMERGLRGEPSSLMMLPTFLSGKGDIPFNEPVIVLDAGGTNFRVASVAITDKGYPLIKNFKKFPMPGTSGQPVHKQEFFDTIAGYVKDIIDTSSKIGFCFSYPTEMLENGDGKLITFTKEVKAPEVEGSVIGQNLLQAFMRAGCSSRKKIVILNDTTATLLAGQTGHEGKKFETYLGFILGTGLNCSYVEKTNAIDKIKNSSYREAHQIINIESGKFARFKDGIIDREFTASTDKPEESKFEKKISGAYQGPLALAVLKKAAADNLFSEGAALHIKSLKTLETKTMDGFLHTPYNPLNPLAQICSSDDRVIMYTLLDRLIERAAKLTAASLAAVVLKTGKGTNPARPVCIAADGTTFFKTKGLKFRTEYYLKQFLEEKNGVYTEFTTREDAPLIGAAVAALEQT